MSLLNSIIIPHFDQVEALALCLEAFSKQDGSYEIIVVDNGTPGLRPETFLDKYSNLAWLTETSQKNPYVLRNKGINQASGENILFLDAKCRPRTDWLSKMTAKMSKKDIVAGRYELSYATDRVKDKVHGILYLNNEKNVREGYGVSAGNLGVKRKLFDEIGLFDEAHHSGGDIMWTQRALSQGYSLTYADKVRVDYPSPSWPLLQEKVQKYGQGAAQQGVKDAGWKKKMPISRKTFKEALAYRNLQGLSKREKLKLWYYASVIKQQYYEALRKT